MPDNGEQVNACVLPVFMDITKITGTVPTGTPMAATFTVTEPEKLTTWSGKASG